MSPEQIENARREKSRFFLACFVMILMAVARALTVAYVAVPAVVQAVSIAALVARIVFMVATWRFARAISLTTPVALFHVVVAAVFGIVPLIVLPRIYGQRTGQPIGFARRDAAARPQ